MSSPHMTSQGQQDSSVDSELAQPADDQQSPQSLSSSSVSEINESATSLDSDNVKNADKVLNNEKEYCGYIRSISRQEPRLRGVVQFVEAGECHKDCVNCGRLDATVITFADHADGPMSHVSFRAINGIQYAMPKLSLEEAIESSGFVRKAIICEDLQPNGAKKIGALLGLEPFVLEYYLNRDASFESHTNHAYVFEYPESYHSESLPRYTDENRLLQVREHARPCTLIRMWKDVYGLFQRIVWAIVFNEKAGAYVHLFLVDSLRGTHRTNATHLSKRLPTFEHFKRFQHSPEYRQSSREQLQEILSSLSFGKEPSTDISRLELEIKESAPIGKAITDLLRTKWQNMILHAQEGISESKAPLTGDLDKIEEVLQRKHDFEKLKRTLSTMVRSLKTLSQNESEPRGILQLILHESSLGGWADQLEKVSQSMLGMLAISESVKATKQAVRSKNLQLLAYIFLPISTVSSIYGMNTAEILDERRQPRNWYFIVGATVAVCGSALLAFLYHALPAPWFVAAIYDDPGAFMVDLGLLILSFTLKTLFVISALLLSFIGTAIWLALFIPIALATATVLLARYICKRFDISPDIKSPVFNFFVHECLPHILAGPTSLIGIVAADYGFTHAGIRAWEYLYFYDIRQPFKIQAESKERRRWKWTRREPMVRESKAGERDGAECIVM